MTASWEGKPWPEIRQAIDRVIATPGFALAEEIFRKYLKAPSYELAQPLLVQEYGGPPLSAHFGKFCKAIAKDLGDQKPAPYALTDLRIVNGTRIRRLKPCIVEAMKN